MSLRKNKRHFGILSLQEQIVQNAEGHSLVLEDLVPCGLEPHSSIDLGERQIVQKVLSKLSSRNRKIVGLCISGFEQFAIAEKVGISQSYVSRIMNMFRKKVDQALVREGIREVSILEEYKARKGRESRYTKEQIDVCKKLLAEPGMRLVDVAAKTGMAYHAVKYYDKKVNPNRDRRNERVHQEQPGEPIRFFKLTMPQINFLSTHGRSPTPEEWEKIEADPVRLAQYQKPFVPRDIITASLAKTLASVEEKPKADAPAPSLVPEPVSKDLVETEPSPPTSRLVPANEVRFTGEFSKSSKHAGINEFKKALDSIHGGLCLMGAEELEFEITVRIKEKAAS
jgi:hypothetical protein